MTEQEIKDWLGVSSSRRLRKSIVTGMAHVRVPEDGPDHLEAFVAFLRCAPDRGVSLWEPFGPDPVHVRFRAEGGTLIITHDGEEVSNGYGVMRYLRETAPLGVPVILEVD